MNDIFKVIEEHIDQHIPWELVPFTMGQSNSMMVIMKGHPKGAVAKAVAERTKQKILVAEDKIKNDILFGGRAEPQDDSVLLWTAFGKTFPLILIASIHGGEDGIRQESSVVIHYKGAAMLDYAHPDFFKHLDAVLDHIIHNDSLAQFSLPI